MKRSDDHMRYVFRYIAVVDIKTVAFDYLKKKLLCSMKKKF